MMPREDVEGYIRAAMAEVVKEHSHLLDVDSSERSLSHHLANALAKFFSEPYQVDVEYNRKHNVPKRLNLKRRKSSDRELKATTVFPDIVVHIRNEQTDNLLVLEIKKDDTDLDYDEEKLLAFREELNYQHAAHVILGYDSGGSLVQEIRWVDI